MHPKIQLMDYLEDCMSKDQIFVSYPTINNLIDHFPKSLGGKGFFSNLNLKYLDKWVVGGYKKGYISIRQLAIPMDLVKYKVLLCLSVHRPCLRKLVKDL